MGDISIVIPSSHRSYNLSNKRLERLLDSNKKNATYMTIWDRIKDFFRAEKKSEALEELYHFIHDNNHSPSQGNDTENTNFITSKINAFHKLQSLANNKDKELFSINRNDRCGIDFYIGPNFIKSIDYCELDYTRYQLNTHPDTKNIISSPEAEQYLYDLIDGIDIPSFDNHWLTIAEPTPKMVTTFNKLKLLANDDQNDLMDGIDTPSFNNHWLTITDPTPKMVATFNKLRLLANDDQKKLFHIDKNERDGIDFYIGSVLIKSLDHCQSSYNALTQLNTGPNIKKYINNTIKDARMTNNQPTSYDLEYLINDITYTHGAAIDGKKPDDHVGCNSREENRKLIEPFYNSLTPPQQKAICEVISKNLFGNIIKNILNFDTHNFDFNSNLTYENYSTVMQHHNDNSSDITIIQTFRRRPKDNHDRNYNYIKELEKKEIKDYDQLYERLLKELEKEEIKDYEYEYEHNYGFLKELEKEEIKDHEQNQILQIDAAFTITSNGGVNCSLLHASDAVRPPVLSLDELKRRITNNKIS